LVGLVFNVMFLGYFKYINFLQGAANDIFDAQFTLTSVILPLGISFITFQKIAFLIDVHSGRVQSFRFRDYLLFVLFFPQLIAGPIVHYREMMPQFHKVHCRFVKEDVAVGLTLFFFGLFKKVVFADSIAALVSPIYQDAAAGGDISFFIAWMAALGFTLQIYFDFSGYSDMALGLGRLFNIRLPANFNSPLRASSIIDYWQRWHMTLTRFLTAYMYNPLSLWLTRRRMSKGRPGLGRDTTFGAFVYLLMFPTLLTMLVSGVWHGAGYNFIIWGLLHGVFLAVNHAWRIVGPPLWPSRQSYERFMVPTGLILTLVAVTVSMVFFRSTTVEGATQILRGMIGLDGVALPQKLFDHLGTVGVWLQSTGVTALSEGNFLKLAMWIAGLLFVALACPNTLEILARYEPALGIKVRSASDGAAPVKVPEWAPSVVWATAVAVIAMLGVANLTGPSEFLYWQF
jgi:D-alanyl-lipoteichoic acid acyltransferase DltB (MBOAT superfamily)